jgi:transcriptional antiterminator RfaH
MWSAAQVKPNQVHIAVRNLVRQNFNVVHPVFQTEKIYRHRKVTVQESLFTGYVFIELAIGQIWSCINSTYGLSADDPPIQ